jgi:hypothetical protein
MGGRIAQATRLFALKDHAFVQHLHGIYGLGNFISDQKNFAKRAFS